VRGKTSDSVICNTQLNKNYIEGIYIWKTGFTNSSSRTVLTKSSTPSSQLFPKPDNSYPNNSSLSSSSLKNYLAKNRLGKNCQQTTKRITVWMCVKGVQGKKQQHHLRHQHSLHYQAVKNTFCDAKKRLNVCITLQD
jgi:hypothetical protein